MAVAIVLIREEQPRHRPLGARLEREVAQRATSNVRA
jgi:hypothetical protein